MAQWYFRSGRGRQCRIDTAWVDRPQPALVLVLVPVPASAGSKVEVVPVPIAEAALK
jgi:hypothetical protein